MSLNFREGEFNHIHQSYYSQNLIPESPSFFSYLHARFWKYLTATMDLPKGTFVRVAELSGQ